MVNLTRSRGQTDHANRVEPVAWALTSAAAYGWLYVVQRRLFLNGANDGPYAPPRVTADVVAAQADLRAYWALAGVVLLTYLWVLVRGRPWGRLAVVAATTGQVVLLLARPGLSIDLLSYLSHGYLAATDRNPYLTASADVANLPYGALLSAEGWTAVHGPTPYGPVWTHLEQLAYLAAPERVAVGLLVLKAVALAATLGSGWLIGRIAELVRPGTGAVAALAWLANPLVIVEFAADGHNDAAAIFLTLLAFWLALTGRPAALVVVALGLGALVKYTPVVFALPLLVLLVRRRRGWPRLVLGLGVGAAVVAGLTWLLWRPWWAGRATLDGLLASGTPWPSPSPGSWLPQPVLAGALALTVLALSWLRPLARAAAGWAAIALVALAVLPVYWPWYAGLAVAVLLLRPTATALAQVFVLTAGSRVAAPNGDLATLGLVDISTMFARDALWGITLPVALCVLIALVGLAFRAGRATPPSVPG